MADEFQTGICSGSWWSSARNLSTPCSAILSDVGSFGWQNEIDTKGRICEDSVSVSCNSMVYQDAPRPQTQESDSIAGGSALSIDSTLQMMGYTLSSPTTDWNQALVHGRSSEQNLGSMLQENSSLRSNFQQESGLDSSHGEKDWSPKNYSEGGGEDPLINPFKHINQVFLFEQHGLDSSSNSSNCKVNCQSLPVNYPTVSASTSLPRLFEPDRQSPYCMNYSSPMSYHMDLNEISPSFPQFVKASSPKQQSNTNHLHFSNNTPFWNASTDIKPSFSSSTFKDNLNCSSLTRKFNNEEGGDSSSVMKRSNETTFKRPRIETPSPLPTFKVRKEKLGDRVTALQQLVSPFGKTDTASVLFEAIEYIKFLHEQVGVLSTPYLKTGAPIQYQQNSDKSKDSEGVKQDLRSRGLCLVPISSTFAVTDTTSDFWTPTFGGSYR